MVFVPVAWIALGAFLAGKRFGQTSDDKAISRLLVPDVSFAARRSLVVDPTARKQVFRSNAMIAMLVALKDGTLERVGRSNDAIFHRLVPRSETWHPPASEQIPASFDAYLSFSCLLDESAEGDRVVVIVPPGSDAVVTHSRMFARFNVPAAAQCLIEKAFPDGLTVSPVSE